MRKVSLPADFGALPFAVQHEACLLTEVDAAAAWCAARGLRGLPGDPLPELLSVRALNRINADLAGFAANVRRRRQT